MTNDLVERMIGHRTVWLKKIRATGMKTRTGLDRYLKLSESVDRVGMQLSTISASGWTVVGMLGVIILPAEHRHSANPRHQPGWCVTRLTGA